MSEEKGVEQATAQEAPKAAPKGTKTYNPKTCRKCQAEFVPTTSNQQQCTNCSPKLLTPKDKRDRDAQNQRAKRERDKAKAEAASLKYNSKEELKLKEAEEILIERGIRHPHVVEFCAELAQTAARLNGIPFNHYLLKNGLRATLSKTTLPEIVDEEVEGEILYRRDLYVLWDYGFWRHPETAFEQWLADRRKFKSSAFELSKILGKEDFGQKHEEWTGFAPRWNPVGLRPGYTQKQGLAWLDSQLSDTHGSKKRYLLVASRNSMKSTWVRILALCLTITYPDARILIVSETNKLSKKAMKEFRGYLEMAPNNPTLFQEHFGEYTVAADDGSSLIYDNPLARLGLPQNSVESSSMESANTGSRFDFAVFDDPISRDNGTANEEQRAAAISKHGSIMKLREPAGFAINIQTPWAKDDLGEVMIARNNEDPERPLAVRIDPVMDIKPEAASKPLLDLTPDDVTLNFLPKLNWKFIRDELRSPEGIDFFKTQYLCQWPSGEEEEKLNFEEAALRRAVINQTAVPSGRTVIVGDIAYSVDARADRSALAVVRISDKANGERTMTVIDFAADRMRLPEFCSTLVRLIRTHDPDSVVLEKSMAWDLIHAEINRWANRYSVSTNIRWFPISNVKDAKFIRLKALSSLLDAGRLTFKAAPYLDKLFAELTNLHGTRGKTKRKDDMADALALAQQLFCPAIHYEEKPDPNAQALHDEQIAHLRRQAQYDRIFGQRLVDSRHGQNEQAPTWREWTGQVKPAPAEPVEPAKPQDPRLRIFGNKGPWRM
jgi:hypothetical protein